MGTAAETEPQAVGTAQKGEFDRWTFPFGRARRVGIIVAMKARVGPAPGAKA
jgi:hypothetical protein